MQGFKIASAPTLQKTVPPLQAGLRGKLMQPLDCIIGEAATELSKGGVHVSESSEVTKGALRVGERVQQRGS